MAKRARKIMEDSGELKLEASTAMRHLQVVGGRGSVKIKLKCLIEN